MRSLRFAPISLLFLFIFGCVHTGVVGDSFVSEKLGFKTKIPEEPFKVINIRGTVLTLIDEESGTSIAVTVTDEKYGQGDKEVGLLYLARGLFIYIDNKDYLVSEDSELGGAPAWHVELSGKAEGVSLMFSAYVVRKNRRIYDIVMWSPPDSFQRAKEILLDMVENFEFLP